MTSNYNLLPGASHFLPFCAGPDVALQFSYTPARIYCKRKVQIYAEVFQYVEARELEDGSLRLLDSMPADDYVGPASHFGSLLRDAYASEALAEAFQQRRLAFEEQEQLRKRRDGMQANTDEYRDVECLLDFASEDAAGVLFSIEKLINAFNQASGFDPLTGQIA